MPNRKLTDENILQMADALADMPRIIKVEKAMRAWGYKSKDSAWKILQRLAELGVVEHVIEQGNEKGEWYLV